MSKTTIGATVEIPDHKATAAQLDEAGAVVRYLAETLAAPKNAGGYVRFSPMFHASEWGVTERYGYPQLGPFLKSIRAAGMRPLMVVIPHYWPTSQWKAEWNPAREWGDPHPETLAFLAIRYRELVATYIAEAKKAGYKESEIAIQWGNEPAAGHPGGNGKAPRGTWTAQNLWNLMHGEFRPKYGDVEVIAPALSMLDQPVADLEMRTARAGAEAWAAPVTRWAMHFRHHRPALSGEAYARSYVEEMGRRARLVLKTFAMPSPSKAKTLSRARLWVTEAYVAEGDCGGDRLVAIGEIDRLLAEGACPDVAHLVWYRVHPLDGADKTFAFPAKALRKAPDVSPPG